MVARIFGFAKLVSTFFQCLVSVYMRCHINQNVFYCWPLGASQQRYSHSLLPRKNCVTVFHNKTILRQIQLDNISDLDVKILRVIFISAFF